MRRSLKLSLFALVLARTRGRFAGLLRRPEVRDAHRRRAGPARSAPTPHRGRGARRRGPRARRRTTSSCRPADQAVADGDTVVLNRARPLRAHRGRRRRSEVYVTALSVDEALEQLGYRADGLVLSRQPQRAPPAGRHGADGHHAQGRRRSSPTVRSAWSPPPPATAGDLLAEQGITLSGHRPRQPLPDPAAAGPHAPAGLPGAGQRGHRDRRRAATRRVETDDPDAFEGDREGHAPRASTASRSPPTASPSSTASRPPASSSAPTVTRAPVDRAGHRRHQGRARPARPSADGLNWAALAAVRVRRPAQRRQRAPATTAACTSSRRRHLARRRRRPATPAAGLARSEQTAGRSCSTPLAVPASGRTAVPACSADPAPLSTSPTGPTGCWARPRSASWPSSSTCVRPSSSGRTSCTTPTRSGGSCAPRSCARTTSCCEVGPGPGLADPRAAAGRRRASSPSRSTPGWPTSCPRTVAERDPDLADRLTVRRPPTRCGSPSCPARRPRRWSPTCPTTSPSRCCCTCSSCFPTLGPGAGPGAGRRWPSGWPRPPGSDAYGVPSVKAAWYGEVRRAGAVGRRVFWPEPNVDSGLVAPGPPAAPAGRPAGHLRRGRRRLRHPAQGAARGPRRLGGQPGGRRDPAAGRRHRPDHPRRAAVGDRLRPAGGDRPVRQR